MVDRIVRGYIIQNEEGYYFNEGGLPYAHKVNMEDAFVHPGDNLPQLLRGIKDWTFKPSKLVPVTEIKIVSKPIDVFGLNLQQILDLIKLEGESQ